MTPRLLVRIRSVLLAISAVFLLSVIAVGLRRDHRVESGFVALQTGAAAQDVLASLGRPSQTNGSCATYGARPQDHCDHVLVWRSSFAPILTRYWLVFVDAAGKMQATSRQVPH
ncbi:MAG TPA: hypothetical protein VGC07_02305 [Granulicella sp.]